MTPEPLKVPLLKKVESKEVASSPCLRDKKKQMRFTNEWGFSEKDIKSAVEWLKVGLCQRLTFRKKPCDICINCETITEAFEDVK